MHVMNKKTPASVYTALRIPPELRERAKKKAAANGRSLSNYIKFLIRRDLGLSIREEGPAYRSNRRQR
jgi:predicted HicB family RNase H-like nuclease